MELNYLCLQCGSWEIEHFDNDIKLGKWAEKKLCYTCYVNQLPSRNVNVITIAEVGKGTSFHTKKER